jgi:hypothetical protein
VLFSVDIIKEPCKVLNKKQHFTWIFNDINNNNTLHGFLMISTENNTLNGFLMISTENNTLHGFLMISTKTTFYMAF